MDNILFKKKKKKKKIIIEKEKHKNREGKNLVFH